jgi:glycerol-3-phosphate acyltransferase PlsY
MLNFTNILTLLGAYLIGAIPSAVWIGQGFYGIDVRNFGSGNAGASNTFRILGRKAGIPVLIIDILKGWSAVNLVYLVGNYQQNTAPFVNFQIACGIAALLGHLFPVYVGFRGGKGVATLLGIITAIHPYTALICMAVFLVVLFSTRIISISSMLAGITFPFVMFLVFQPLFICLKIFSVSVAVMVVLTHKKNIGRLIRGEEFKVNFFKKKETNI